MGRSYIKVTGTNQSQQKMTIHAIGGWELRSDKYCRSYRKFMNLNFSILILCFRCVAFMLLSLFYASPKNRCYVDFMLISLLYASTTGCSYVTFMIICLFYDLSTYVLLCSFYAYQFISFSVTVVILSLFYASIKKHYYVTLILPHGRIFSTESLLYIILASIRICYAKFMIRIEV